MAVNDDFTLFGVICFIPLLILGDPEKRKQAIEMMTNPMWLSQFILMIMFTCYVLFFYNPTDIVKDAKTSKLNIRRAIYQGAMAFVIAICAAFDFTVLPFWLVFLSSYFFSI